MKDYENLLYMFLLIALSAAVIIFSEPLPLADSVLAR